MKTIHSKEYCQLIDLLRSKRLDMNITQEQLAARLGIQQGVISKIETHERRIDVIELRSICHAIGISFTDFISQLDTIIANQEIQSL